MPSPGSPLTAWIEGRDWLFAEESYHLDTSHLAMVVRLSPLLSDPTTITLARGLCHYGAQLSVHLRPDGESPFDDFYADHHRYLDALTGEAAAVDATVTHFRTKLAPTPNPFDRDAPVRAQTLVRLLDRLGRAREAFDLAAEHLAHVPDGALGEPGLTTLGLRLQRWDELADLAQAGDDPVRFAAVRLEAARRSL